MKASKIMTVLAAGLLLLAATSAFAGSKGSMTLNSSATVAGKELKPGNYSVQWTGEGAALEVKVMEGKNVVASAPAHMVDLAQAPGYDSTVVRTDGSGGRTINQIRFAGKKFALEILDESAKGAGTSNGSTVQ